MTKPVEFNSLDAMHACKLIIHTLNRYRFYMHCVSKKNVWITKNLYDACKCLLHLSFINLTYQYM